MSEVNNLLQNISEIERIISNNKLEELKEEYDYISEQISQDFYKLKKYSQNVTNILERNFNGNFANNNFDVQELIEEKLDELFYEYLKIKGSFKKGREIRTYKEKKENEIKIQKKLGKNILIQHGIKSAD